MTARKIKVGIDVGGTFTHAVAIDLAGYALAGKACVPTTHSASEGVARGVAESLKLLLERSGVEPAEVVLIAHSTTQATNALLEGDTAPVGIACLGRGLEGRLAARQANISDMEIAPGKVLETCFRYVELDDAFDAERALAVVAALKAGGARAIVATKPFGVDDPKHELLVAEAAASMGLPATAASTLSKLYGLRVRTRTAVLNAAMMPKMLETADMTERSVRECGIEAPLMVMRSDGGIMDVAQMRRRPILTMLSGPAAGVAAALMYARVSDGIFLEVGGTSTDISVIRNGKPQVKSARIGGYHLYLKTLDVRTLGIAGGSVPRLRGSELIDVGPRSAHIAGLSYVSFARDVDFSNIELGSTRPLAGDPADYLAIRPADRAPHTVTPTCAANLLGFGKEAEGHGEANMDAIAACFESLARILGKPARQIATEILRIAANKIAPVVARLIREYKLDPRTVRFVGGGGGACAIVPFAAREMGVPYQLTENLEVISAIGAALGMIRDTVEKTVLNPTEADILAIRQEAIDSVLAMGAIADTIEASVEVDAKNKKVIAVATGSSEFRTPRAGAGELPEPRLLELCGESLRASPAELSIAATTGPLCAVQHRTVRRRFFGLLRQPISPVRVIDRAGTIRLQLPDATVASVRADAARSSLAQQIDEATRFGDAGAMVPDVFLLAGPRLLDFTGLVTQQQIAAVTAIELARTPPAEQVVLLVAPKE